MHIDTSRRSSRSLSCISMSVSSTAARRRFRASRERFTECLSIYRAVLYLKERSGGSWSDELGANIINGIDDDSWNDICLQRPACAPFRNKGWIPFHWFESLDPAKAKGDSVYRPGISRALLPSNLSQSAPNASQHAPTTSQNMYNTSSNTPNGVNNRWGGNFMDSPQGPMLSLPDFVTRSLARAGSPDWNYQQMDEEFGGPLSQSNLFDLPEEGFSRPQGAFDRPQDDYGMDGIDPDSSLTSTLGSSSPIPPALVPSTPVTSTTRTTIPATSKKAKTSKLNAADAMNNLGAALTTFGNQFEKSTSGFTDAVRVSNDQASPVRRRNAIDLVDKEDWLTIEQQMALGDVVKMTDNADTYLNWASKGEEKRKAWVTHELTKAGKM
ncbi:hypothetical protein C8F01DRAFT_1068141 [Mycena amicta]|nr:hypothetical protein C8F01DRAFT_1068141 [Mycena amicta]